MPGSPAASLMREELTFIMGGLTAPARALSARLLARSERVVLVDKADPVAALTAERAPMLGHEVPSLVTRDWRTHVDSGQLSGAAVDRDVIPWTVGTLGLLRPTRIVLCVSLRSDATRPTRLASALTAFTSELGSALAAINEYCRLLHEEQCERPRIIVSVSGAVSASQDNAIMTMTRALVHELVPDAGAPVQVALLPRLLGAGAQLDLLLQRMLRRLLMAEHVKVSHDETSTPHWLSASEAATLLEELLLNGTHGADSPPGVKQRGSVPGPSRQERGGPHITAVRGLPVPLSYLAGVMATEVDRLLPDPAVRRASLVDVPVPTQAPPGTLGAIADILRFTVRWHAANATLLSSTS